MRSLPTAVIAGAALVVGFVAVQVTGLPWLGGALVIAGAAWCFAREAGRTAAWRLAVVVLLGAACFVVSHVLAGVVGAWPAVAVAALGLAGGAWWLVDRRPRRS